MCARACCCFAQIARAVGFAHGKLVVHSDLKPANILVSREGVARLLDFGIARLLDDDARASHASRKPPAAH